MTISYAQAVCKDNMHFYIPEDENALCAIEVRLPMAFGGGFSAVTLDRELAVALETLIKVKKENDMIAERKCDFSKDNLLEELDSIEKKYRELKEKSEGDNMVHFHEILSFSSIRNGLKTLHVILDKGINLGHLALIRDSESYLDYRLSFEKYVETRYSPFRFEIMEAKEEWELIKGAVKW